MEKIEELLKKILADKKLVKELSKLENKEAFIEKLKQAGYELSEEDLQDIAKILETTELSDEDLDNAVGGMASRYDVML